jgi:hypothetical protein
MAKAEPQIIVALSASGEAQNDSWKHTVFFGLYEKIQVILKIFLKKTKN